MTRFRLKRILLVLADTLLAVYIVFAFASFNEPDRKTEKCTQVSIDIQDVSANGFIDTREVKNRLERAGDYPLGRRLAEVNTRRIEEGLKASPFVRTTDCYKTIDGHVVITLTQRTPTVRIKAVTGDDYYLDDNNRVMPNSHYTSDMIIATGHISRWYAQNYISHLAHTLMASDLWRNQIEQINVLQDRSVELVPRVGEHIVCLGRLPESKYASERKTLITEFTEKKMDRLEKFYKYGLSQAGWNKYSRIDLQYDNQIICKRRETSNHTI